MNPGAAGSLEVGGDGVLHMAGHVGYANAERLLPRGRAALASGQISRIDLTGLQNADSATLAILLVLSAEASQSNRSLSISGAPGSLRALAQLCDVESLLRLD